MPDVKHLTTSVSHPAKWECQTEQSYNSHSTAQICWPKPKRLESVRAKASIRVRQTCTKVHECDIFSFVSSWHSSETTTVLQWSSLTNYSSVQTHMRCISLDFLQRSLCLDARTIINMRRRSARYKYHHNSNEHIKPEFVPSWWVFVDKLPWTSGRNMAHRMKTACHNKD